VGLLGEQPILVRQSPLLRAADHLRPPPSQWRFVAEIQLFVKKTIQRGGPLIKSFMAGPSEDDLDAQGCELHLEEIKWRKTKIPI
jgi:hypothetical protein